MNPTLRKYMALADEAQTYKKTLASQEKFLRLVKTEPEILNLGNVTRGLEPLDKIRVGSLVTFSYHAKGAADLPYWDRYPLVMITDITKDGFSGINFHYIHPRMRARMLYEMHSRNKSIIDHEITNFCVRRYLLRQISTRPRLFPDEYFDVAIQLPFENFMKSGKIAVWSDTARKVK